MLTALLLAGLAARSAAPATVPPDRLVVLAAGDAEYLALAIPRSYKSAPEAPHHLLVFRGGLCVRDIGLSNVKSSGTRSSPGKAFIEETGSTELAYLAPDGRNAVILRTRYVSRVEVTPGQAGTEDDTVTVAATLTLVDPAHPDGAWQVTLENGRWPKDVLALSGGHGVVVTSFLPRNGPTDFRILDASGYEKARVRETTAECVGIAASPDGAYVAADVAFPDQSPQGERGVIVFDLAKGTSWTYGWRYGGEAEPLSWSLENRGVLAVKLPRGTKRFTAADAPR